MQDTLPHRGKPRAILGESNVGPAALFRGRFSALYLFAIFSALLIAAHAPLLRLPYFWDEAGYYVPAALDLAAGSPIPHSTPSNAHPPLVLAWLALCWKLVGFHPAVTRCAMLLLAAFALLGFFRLALVASNVTVAAWATLLTALYPVFFAQSSLAQVDLPAAGLIFWGLESYFRKRRVVSVVWFSLAALAKETAILAPIALGLWAILSAVLRRRTFASTEHTSPAKAGHLRAFIGTSGTRALPGSDVVRSSLSQGPRAFYDGLLLASAIPLAFWYAYHYLRTGYVFGNPEFFRYNVQATLHPLRMFLAFLLRLWQTVGYLDLYVLTLACVVAMRFSPIRQPRGERSRIDLSIQFSFLAIAIVYLVSLSVIGGAVLARYMLPVVPLMILVCVSTIYRRLPTWKAVIIVVALAFISALFVNPPYGFSPEDNLAYRDYIRLHQRAETFLQARYPNARVLSAWPASDEVTHPYLV